ncbi:hypothetical protein Tco_0649138 [Tanacetum coccineum]
MYLKHHEGQIEDILNYLEELSFRRIEKMEEGRIDRMIIRRNSDELKTELKEIRTQIIKLQKKRMSSTRSESTNFFRIALKAQAASMASDSNPNRNTRPTSKNGKL